MKANDYAAPSYKCEKYGCIIKYLFHIDLYEYGRKFKDYVNIAHIYCLDLYSFPEIQV